MSVESMKAQVKVVLSNEFLFEVIAEQTFEKCNTSGEGFLTLPDVAPTVESVLTSMGEECTYTRVHEIWTSYCDPEQHNMDWNRFKVFLRGIFKGRDVSDEAMERHEKKKLAELRAWSPTRPFESQDREAEAREVERDASPTVVRELESDIVAKADGENSTQKSQKDVVTPYDRKDTAPSRRPKSSNSSRPVSNRTSPKNSSGGGTAMAKRALARSLDRKEKAAIAESRAMKEIQAAKKQYAAVKHGKPSIQKASEMEEDPSSGSKKLLPSPSPIAAPEVETTAEDPDAYTVSEQPTDPKEEVSREELAATQPIEPEIVGDVFERSYLSDKAFIQWCQLLAEVDDQSIQSAQFQGRPYVYTGLAQALAAANRLSLKTLGPWSDPSFGPSDSDPRGLRSLFFKGAIPTGSRDLSFSWGRVGEAGAQVLNGRVADLELVPSLLFRDEWFLGALGAAGTSCGEESLFGKEGAERCLASDPSAPWGVYPRAFWDPALRNKGIHCFRFWKGQWLYVIVDDRVPVASDGRPLASYGITPDGQFDSFVMLVEKAYAKLHGCYEALSGGFTDDAVEDLLGHPVDRVSLAKAADLPKAQHTLMKALEMESGSLVAVRNDNPSTEELADSNGRFVKIQGDGVMLDTFVQRGFGYAIETIRVTNDKVLVQLRDHWGNDVAMNGVLGRARPDVRLDVPGAAVGTSCLSEQLRGEHDLGNLKPADAGKRSFLLSLDEMSKVFSHVLVCKKVDKERGWEVRDFKSQWTEATMGGTPIPIRNLVATPESWGRNPQVLLEVGGGGAEVVAQLSQPDERLSPKSGAFPFNDSDMKELFLCIMKTGDGRCPTFDRKAVLRDGGVSLISRRRSVTISVNCPPGRYVVVPSTWEMGQKRAFRLSINVRNDSDRTTAPVFMARMLT